MPPYEASPMPATCSCTALEYEDCRRQNTDMAKTRIAIVGLGKIARDQHVPSLAASDAFELVGVASPHNKLDGVPSYGDLQTLLQAVPDIAAVSLCTTPQVRYE